MNRIFLMRKLLVNIFLVFVASGCSVSYSLETSSESISASSDSFFSISRSSGGSAEEAKAAFIRFKDDVRALARVFYHESGSGYGFERQLGTLAKSHGLTDWESEPATFQAIGSGLRQAGVQGASIKATPFLQSQAMERNLGLIMEGYLDA